MPYTHRFSDGRTFNHGLGKVVCVGRNYAEHAKELNNPIPTTPLLFMKPATAVVSFEDDLPIPSDRGSVHYELELSVLIGKPLKNANEQQVQEAIAGYGLGLDLTLRDVQSELKEKGQPWERAKCFDASCPLSKFVTPEQLVEPQTAKIALEIDGEIRQNGSTADMLNPIVPLITYMSTQFTLNPGDVVLTGTPKGVGALEIGQKVSAKLNDVLTCSGTVVEAK